MEIPFLGEILCLNQEVACRLVSQYQIFKVNGCAHHHQWDVKFDIPHQSKAAVYSEIQMLLLIDGNNGKM